MKLPPLMAEEINKALKMCFEKKKKGMKSFEVCIFCYSQKCIAHCLFSHTS